ncbi:unnamed protein product, partial [Polarella glacialis]
VLLLKGGPSSLDTEILRMASRLQPDYTIVLTKVDLLEQQSDVRRVVQLISELISKYRLKAQIIPSSVKSCRGRDILWKRLWKAVDPDEAWRWQTAPNDLAEAKQRMDEMAEAGDWEQLVESVDWAKKKRLSDFWEYGVRCMVRMGKLREAWQWVKQADDSWEEESSASPDLVPEDEDEQYAEEEQYAADKETEAAFEDAKKEKERERNKRRRDRELFLEQREAEGEEEDEKEKQRQDKMMDELLLGLEQVVVETSEAAGEEQEGERQELELEMENEEEEEEEEILEYKDSAGDEDNDGSDDVDHVMRPKQAARGKSSRGAAFVRDRAALVVGFAALAPALSKAGEGVNEMEVPVDLELAQEVLDVLSTEHISRSSAVELMLEWCVADARQGARALALSSAPTPSSSSSAPAPRAAEPPEAKLAYDQMFVRLNHFVSSVKAWNSPPWSADRWNQLIRWTGKRRELQSVELVLDAMKACRVKGSEHTDATMRDLAVACVHLVCEAETCSKLDGRLRSAARLPEVVVLGSVGMDVRSGVSSLVDSMLTATPRRRPEDEIESLSGLGTEGQRGGRVRSGSRNSRRGKTTKPEQQDDVKLEGVGRPRLGIEKARQLAAEQGGQCLSTDYVSVHDKLLWQCYNGHSWSAPLGSWCPVGAVMKKRLSLDVASRLARSRNLRGKMGGSACLTHLCAPNRHFAGYANGATFGMFLRGSYGRPLELDGFCEFLNLAFEYHGEQHYSPEHYWNQKRPGAFQAQLERDQLKVSICEAVGVRLVVVPAMVLCRWKLLQMLAFGQPLHRLFSFSYFRKAALPCEQEQLLIKVAVSEELQVLAGVSAVLLESERLRDAGLPLESQLAATLRHPSCYAQSDRRTSPAGDCLAGASDGPKSELWAHGGSGRLQARSARLVREEAEDPEQEKWVMRGLELDSDLRHRVRIDIAQARAKVSEAASRADAEREAIGD